MHSEHGTLAPSMVNCLLGESCQNCKHQASPCLVTVQPGMSPSHPSWTSEPSLLTLDLTLPLPLLAPSPAVGFILAFVLVPRAPVQALLIFLLDMSGHILLLAARLRVIGINYKSTLSPGAPTLYNLVGPCIYFLRPLEPMATTSVASNTS